jgi:hypothetical protein
VCDIGEAWIDDDDDDFPLIVDFWTHTDETREVPL